MYVVDVSMDRKAAIHITLIDFVALIEDGIICKVYFKHTYNKLKHM